MAIFRIQKKENPYVILDKTFINDTRLSWKARGLLTYLLSLPTDWEIHIRDLIKRAPDGRDSIYNGIQELKQCGYVVHQHVRNTQGKYEGGTYCVYEQPTVSPSHSSSPALSPASLGNFSERSLPHPENPDLEKPHPDFPDRENPPLLNNNRNKYTKNKIIKTTATTETEKISTEEAHSKSMDDAAAISVQKKVGKFEVTTSAQKRLNPSQSSPSASVDPAIPVEEKKKAVAAVSLPVRKDQRSFACIGQTLTAEQMHYLEKYLAECELNSLGMKPAELKQQICLTLLDPKSFSLAGNDFFKKLNTIQKVIRQGKWHVSASALQHEQKRQDQALQPLRQELREARAEQSHWQTLKTTVQEKKQMHLVPQLEHWIIASTTRVTAIKNKLTALQQRLQAEEDFSLLKPTDVLTESSSPVPVSCFSHSAAACQENTL